LLNWGGRDKGTGGERGGGGKSVRGNGGPRRHGFSEQRIFGSYGCPAALRRNTADQESRGAGEPGRGVFPKARVLGGSDRALLIGGGGRGGQKY